MTSRERMRTTLRRQVPDRMPRCEQSFWPETLERWQQEGMPEGSTPAELFDLDSFHNYGLDNSLQLPTATLEETAEWIVERDANGVAHKRWLHSYHAPAEIDFLIKTREDWERYRERLEFSPDRISEGVRQAISMSAEAGAFCTVSPGEPVWWTLWVLGMENGLMTLAGDPDFFADMMQWQARLAIKLMEELLAGGSRPDGVLYSSDLCYRSGMLFSPASYRRSMMEYHREMARLCHENDMLLILHCDGDVRNFIPLLIEAEFDCIEPLEARQGPDVRELKPLYGDQISFFGNINMDVLATGDRELIRHEVTSKVEVAKVGGGYVHQSDHSVPPTVSYEAYCYWMELAKELGEY